MTESNPKLRADVPKNVFKKSLQADFKELFKSLTGGVTHVLTGNWEELSKDTVDTLSAIGLETKPEELVFLLIKRSIINAIFKLVDKSIFQQIIEIKKDRSNLLNQIDFSILLPEISIDDKFLDRPADLTILPLIQTVLAQWLECNGLNVSVAQSIAHRLPSYFIYELNKEWRINSKSYLPLLDSIKTPFAKAGDREWAWATYAAFLQRRIEESVFDEPFSLKQIYIPLNAYYSDESVSQNPQDDLVGTVKKRNRNVISLEAELDQWLKKSDQIDAMRIISGGPGSGKSSFSRIFASKVAQEGRFKVLFIPLHLIDPNKELTEEIGRFVRDEGILIQNPLDPESPEPNLLIIFDGLDELASQGKAAAETARSFVREIERTLERRNSQGVKLRVVIGGRELVIQENESEFRRPRQVLTLLPYYIPTNPSGLRSRESEEDNYQDPKKLLKNDLRQLWWKNYGALTGKGYEKLPQGLDRFDLSEVTAQPLLNFLVSLSFSRKKLDFAKEVNLNSIYSDLLTGVYERGYERNRNYIRPMKLQDFIRVLEEIGLAAWHGDGRKTTVKEIKDHCQTSGLGGLLDIFQEGAESGVTRLLAAFFFRQYGQRPTGEPTFVFTHKSFGEYLAAQRIIRATGRIIDELERRMENLDSGWDERDALRHWCQICGPSAISKYLFVFIDNEMKLKPPELIEKWQLGLSKLFNYVLRNGMTLDNIHAITFKDALFQSRNAEESLLIVLNSCARVTKKISNTSQPSPTTFGTWLRRIQGQRSGPEGALVLSCLSYLDLNHCVLHISDLYGADLSYSNLEKSSLIMANLERANLVGANFKWAHLHKANFRGANLKNTDFENAYGHDVEIEEAIRTGSNFSESLIGRNIKRSKSSPAATKTKREQRGQAGVPPI